MGTAVKLAYISTDPALAPLNELDCVRLRRALEHGDGQVIPAGSLGAVLTTWDSGSSYEVEFSEPFHALAIVRTEDLEREASA